jgi:hypothetical protein
MNEYPIVPKPYPLCVHCAMLASIAFLYFNLTQWTPGYRNGRYSAFRFPYPNVLWANINSPLLIPIDSEYP